MHYVLDLNAASYLSVGVINFNLFPRLASPYPRKGSWIVSRDKPPICLRVFGGLFRALVAITDGASNQDLASRLVGTEVVHRCAEC